MRKFTSNFVLALALPFIVSLTLSGCLKKEAISEAPLIPEPPAEQQLAGAAEAGGSATAGAPGAEAGLREESLRPEPGAAAGPMARGGREGAGPRSLREERLREKISRRGPGAAAEAGAGRPSESPSTTMVARIPKPAVPTGEAVSSPLKDIYFKYDNYDLEQDSKETLSKMAAWLDNNPKLNLLIEGHTDERGTGEYNLVLGERRADAALRYLRQLGISAARLSIVSYGEMRPANPEHDDNAWEQNRRDSFVVIAR